MLRDQEIFGPSSCYFTYEKYHYQIHDRRGWTEPTEIKLVASKYNSTTASIPSPQTTSTLKARLLSKMYDTSVASDAKVCKDASEHSSTTASIASPQKTNSLDCQEQNPSTFKPTWLIDTSDMSVVPGSKICEPYHTLSYSWNQSGEYFKNKHNDEYTRIDKGRHKIILDPNPVNRESHLPPVRVKYVKFEELVREICNDFGVRYLWWDQWCIDQSNKEEKRREIKQMHKIYENACRTIVLVPEFDFTGRRHPSLGMPVSNISNVLDSQWFKRVWTFVEGFKAKKLLFVGRNVHATSEIFNKSPSMYPLAEDFQTFLTTICAQSYKWNACLALSHFRKRVTTKKHDYYFAFANIFPDKLATLKFSYDQDIQELALNFYQRPAQNEPSILYFGASKSCKEKTERTLLAGKLESDPLPSWTGIDGVHPINLFKLHEYGLYSCGLSDDNYIVSESTIQLTCASISVTIVEDRELSKRPLDDMPAFFTAEKVSSEMQTEDRLFYRYLPPPINLRPCGDSNLTFIAKANIINEQDRLYSNPLQLQMTHYLPYIEKDNLYGYLSDVPKAPTMNQRCATLSLTEYCNDCIILFGMLKFRETEDHRYSGIAPVIKKNGDYYKSIGLCVFEKECLFPDIDTKTKQTFIIR